MENKKQDEVEALFPNADMRLKPLWTGFFMMKKAKKNKL